MRTSLLLLAVLIPAVAFIFYAGNFTPTDTPRLHANPTVQPTAAIIDGVAPISPPNHNALLMQGDRVDPEAWLKREHKRSALYPQDARAVMKGWFETDPAAALAWAQTPKDSENIAHMAAEILMLNATGDPQKLAASLLAFPAGDHRAKFCIDTYFELVLTTTGNLDPAAIYEELPAPLAEAAWPITMERLTATDIHLAADWLTEHIDDPGRTDKATGGLIRALVDKDHAGIAQWAATFPDNPKRSRYEHPAFVATGCWLVKDPAAAEAWLQTQPTTLQWVQDTYELIGLNNRRKTAEAPKAEN